MFACMVGSQRKEDPDDVIKSFSPLDAVSPVALFSFFKQRARYARTSSIIIRLSALCSLDDLLA
jgi:hypothetical protein